MSVKIQMAVSELRRVLPGVGKVVGPRSTLPILGTVKLKSERNSGTSIQGSNLDDFVSVKLNESVVEGPIETLVPYDELCRAVKSGSETIEINVEEERTTLIYAIEGATVHRKLDQFDLKEWPQVPVMTDQIKSIPVATELKEAIQQGLGCSSDDGTRMILQSVCLDAHDPKAHYVVGTNGRILYSANTFHFDHKGQLVLPKRKFLQWDRFWDDGDCSLVWQEGKKKSGFIQLKSEHWTFTTREMDGSFPNWKQNIPMGKWSSRVQFNEDAVKTLRLALPKMPGAGEPNRAVTLTLGKNSLLLQAREGSDPWTTLPVTGATVEGLAMQIALNREYLLKALEFGLTELHLTDELTPLVFHAPGKRLVVMPVRLGGEPSAAVPVQPVPTPVSPENTERKSMPKEVNRIESKETVPVTAETSSTFEQLEKQVETIKQTLRTVVIDLNEMLRVLAIAHKEKRTTDREMKAFRESLKEIQSFQI